MYVFQPVSCISSSVLIPERPHPIFAPLVTCHRPLVWWEMNGPDPTNWYTYGEHTRNLLETELEEANPLARTDGPGVSYVMWPATPKGYHLRIARP